MTSHYRDNQYSDPFTDRPGQNLHHEDSFSPPLSSYPQHDYRSSTYSPSMTDDPVSTVQSGFVQRRQSTGHDIHSGTTPSNTGAAAEFYNSGPAANTNLNSSAGAGKDRLSVLDEDDDYGYSKQGHYGGGYSDSGDKVKPFDDAQDVSLMKNAAGPGQGGFHDMGE